MTNGRTDEQLLHDWMTETVWLPESDLSGLATRVHQTPQHRGLLPPLDPRRIARMFSATKALVAGITVALIGGFLLSGPLPGGGEPQPAPAAISPGTEPEQTPVATSVATEGPLPTDEPASSLAASPSSWSPTPAPTPHWRKNGKVYLVVEKEAERMVKGQTQRLTAKWCRGGECWPADDVTWSVDTTKVLKLEPTKGAWTDVKAKDAGIGFLSVGEGRNQSSPTILVYPRPGASDPPVAVTPLRVEVAYPNEIVLKLGQHAVVTGWRCPTRDKAQLGADAVPGTADDTCRTREIGAADSFLGTSGLGLVGMVGPSAVLVAKEHIGLDYALVPDPVRLSFTDRLETEGVVRSQAVGTSHVYVRDAEFDGLPLGDLDADKQVDEADAAILNATIEEHGPRITPQDLGWRRTLDLNRDRRIDDIDQAVLGLLIGSHAGQIEPQRLTPRQYPDYRGRMPFAAAPFADAPAPTPVPTTTPTQ